MPPSVSTHGDGDALVRQVRWCAAVQTPINCHCQLEEYQVGDVELVKFVVQYVTQAAVKLPSVGLSDLSATTRAATFNTRCNLSVTVLGTPANCTTSIQFLHKLARKTQNHYGQVSQMNAPICITYENNNSLLRGYTVGFCGC